MSLSKHKPSSSSSSSSSSSMSDKEEEKKEPNRVFSFLSFNKKKPPNRVSFQLKKEFKNVSLKHENAGATLTVLGGSTTNPALFAFVAGTVVVGALAW
jgi:hypothetical protein